MATATRTNGVSAVGEAEATMRELIPPGEKLRVEFGALTMAEQAELFERGADYGLPDDPQTATPAQGIRFNAAVAWAVLHREHPELEFDTVFRGLRGNQVEVVTGPPAGAGDAG